VILSGFILWMLMSTKNVNVNYVEVGPKVDGVIDDIWQQADSAYDFIQSEPYEKEKSTEKTVVYLLQDPSNIYFAFVCYAENHKITANLTREEDVVAVGIDPFGNKTTGYYFLLNASGIIDDGWVLDDGRNMDDSWDGVWYDAIRLYADRYVVEFKIPFKTIRYKKGLDTWGIQFKRFIAENRESDFWTEVMQIEGDLVSKWSTITGLNPQAQGYYFELYPEGYVRADRQWYDSDSETADTTSYKPSASFNIKWDITPQTTLNGTMYPDFAQIESDPFTLNLGRYPTYLDERRPFFLEGNDIFRMSDFGEGKGFFLPLELFYSRRVGKSMNGDAVPIIGGLKLTDKSDYWNLGLLGAYTGEYMKNDSLLEPDRGYSAFRLKRRVFENSDMGMLFSGTMAGTDDYNYALGLDGVYRKGFNQAIIQGALSDMNEKRGWAVSSGFFGFLGSFLTLGGATAISDSFDVNNIGFVPWAGQKRVTVLSGPFKQYPRGLMSSLLIAPGAIFIQEAGSKDWSKLAVMDINPNTRNNWGCDLSLYLGPYYEADTNYLYRSISMSAWGRLFGQHLEVGSSYNYTYNYRLGFLAYQADCRLTYNYSIMEHLSTGIRFNAWFEWDPFNTLSAITSQLRPNFNIRFTRDMNLNLFSEFVLMNEGADISGTELFSARTGALYSWNFMPKSWIYIALNDYRADQDASGSVQPVYQVGAVKVKYLLYF